MYKLINGDCLEEYKNIGRVDYVFTSPPYNRKRNDKYDNYVDKIDDYYQFLVDFTDKYLPLTNKHFIINLQTNYYNKVDVYRYIGKYAEKIQQIFIWEKTNPMPANGNNITNAYEMFIVLGDTAIKSNTTYTKNHITTTINNDTTTKIHKAVMKSEVCDWFIEKFTKENDTIVDPFMGLGTTGVSCEKFKRNFIGIELNKDYYEIALLKVGLFQKNSIFVL